MTPIPRVSVCLPTCDGEPFVAAAIASVLAQSFEDFELIVSDDCSHDRTLEVIHAFSDRRLVVHAETVRLGIPGNWNRALSRARGEYACVFHQDDVMAPTNLAEMAATLSADPTVAFAHSAVQPEVAAGTPPFSADWLETATASFSMEGRAYLRRLLLHGNRVCAPAVMARRAVVETCGGFDETLRFACDYALWMRLCLSGRVSFVARPLVFYRWHARNASHRFNEDQAEAERREATDRALAQLRSDDPTEAAILAEALEVQRKLTDWLRAVARHRDDLESARVNLEARVARLELERVRIQLALADQEAAALRNEVLTKDLAAALETARHLDRALRVERLALKRQVARANRVELLGSAESASAIATTSG